MSLADAPMAAPRSKRSIAAAMADAKLLGASFPELGLWAAWTAVLKAAFAELLDWKEQHAFSAVSGSRKPPNKRVRELWCLIGRRGGKSRMAAALAVHAALLIDHKDRLSPGEVGHVLVLAASRPQAATVLNYIKGILDASPIFAGEIESVTIEEIKLRNGITIGVHSANYRTVRGAALSVPFSMR